MAKTFARGQHVRSGSKILVVCSGPTSRGTYTVRPLTSQSMSGYAPGSILTELTEADLCRKPRCTCGLIHPPAGYVIGQGVALEWGRR